MRLHEECPVCGDPYKELRELQYPHDSVESPYRTGVRMCVSVTNYCPQIYIHPRRYYAVIDTSGDENEVTRVSDRLEGLPGTQNSGFGNVEQTVKEFKIKPDETVEC